MNKTVHDLKIRIDTLRKPQLEVSTSSGSWTGMAEGSLTNRIQEMEARTSCIIDMIEEMDTPVKENVKSEKNLTSNKSGTLWKDQV